MQILVNGKPAAVKKGTSFDICFENRYFSGADSYSMAITFPLKDCAQNIAIFGYINRRDVAKKNLLLECEIRDRAFCLRGSIAITSITDVEVKTQFLEGRSATNYSCALDSIYLNEMTLGYPDTSHSAHSAYQMDGINLGANWVCLPWVNNSSGNVQNDVKLSADGATWASTPAGISYQPYMLYILKRIFEVLGYTYNLTSLENSNYRYMIFCNTLPYAWNVQEFAKAFPHWTLTEFFEQLEYLFNGEFDFDHNNKTVKFTFSRDAVSANGTTELTKVVDEFTTTIKDASDCKYRERNNLKYADCDHMMWKYYVNPQVIEEIITRNGGTQRSMLYREYDTFASLSAGCVSSNISNYEDTFFTSSGYNALMYVKDIDRYYLLRRVRFHQEGESTLSTTGEIVPWGTYELFLQCVNNFAPKEADPDAETIELKIVPAWIGDTTREKGQVIFLEMPNYAMESNGDKYGGFGNYTSLKHNLRMTADWVANLQAESGDKKEANEYLDKIYVAFYGGGTQTSMYAHPILDATDVYPSGGYISYPGFDLLCLAKGDRNKSYDIDPTVKHTFKFLSKDVPNVRSLFFINGKRYLCEKLTATFTESGRSELLKGDFWQVI